VVGLAFPVSLATPSLLIVGAPIIGHFSVGSDVVAVDEELVCWLWWRRVG